MTGFALTGFALGFLFGAFFGWCLTVVVLGVIRSARDGEQ